MIIILLGPSGCGKGTQAKLLSEGYHIPRLSSGEILRGEYEKRTADGIDASKYWLLGNWVPDNMMNKILYPILSQEQLDDGFVLDAYPRTVGQAKDLDGFLNLKGKRINNIIHFTLSLEESMNRMNIRKEYDIKVVGKARADEGEEVMKIRLQNYNENINSILDYYKEVDHNLIDIDASENIDVIFNNIKNELKGSNQN